MAIRDFMKAAQLTQYGGKEVITIGDIPAPIIEDGKILIQVKAAGVNPFDWKVQQGYMKDFIPLKLPIVLGGDFAGVVVEVGASVSDFKKGDEVYGQANAVAGNSGAFAEMTLTTSTSVALKPKTLEFAQAGALPLVGVSAIQALIDTMKLTKGQKILIHGGAGGIGSIAIQIAKNIGAHVATTGSANDFDFIKQLGADELIDYKTQKFEDTLKMYDAVFDTVGGETTNRSLSVLKNGGILVSMTQPADETVVKEQQIKAVVQGTQVTTERLKKLTQLVESGVVKVNVEKTFPLEQAADALEYLKTTPPKGKVVIVM